MLSQAPLAVIASTARSTTRMRALMLFGCSSWTQRFMPYTLGILGLVIAVVLWGAGYKLSLYHRHTTPSSVPIAKLWIESRNAPAATASRIINRSQLVLDFQALSVPIQRLPHNSRALACILSVCTPSVAYFSFLIPFRSPPSPRFFLA
jgi:hypothetical protein